MHFCLKESVYEQILTNWRNSLFTRNHVTSMVLYKPIFCTQRPPWRVDTSAVIIRFDWDQKPHQYAEDFCIFGEFAALEWWVIFPFSKITLLVSPETKIDFNNIFFDFYILFKPSKCTMLYYFSITIDITDRITERIVNVVCKIMRSYNGWKINCATACVFESFCKTRAICVRNIWWAAWSTQMY